jgi:hypothetical protein
MTTFEFIICFILVIGVTLVITNNRSKYPILSFNDYCTENEKTLDVLTLDEKKEIYIEYKFHRKQDLLFFLDAHVNRTIKERYLFTTVVGRELYKRDNSKG